MPISINNNVVNFGGTPGSNTGILANRPSAIDAPLGTFYISTDTQQIFSNTVTGWVDVTIGSGGGGLPAGGQLGEVLQKNSATNYDAGWKGTLIDLSNYASIDYQARHLIDKSGTYEVVDWYNCIMNDNNHLPSIDWDNRKLWKNADLMIDYDAGVLWEYGNFGPSIDWINGILYGSGNATIYYKTHLLIDLFGNESLNWNTRVLKDSLGAPSINYDLISFIDNGTKSSIDFSIAAVPGGAPVGALLVTIGGNPYYIKLY